MSSVSTFRVDEKHVYLRAMYDYSYNDKGTLVSIRAGDVYLLLSKTTQDWWRVESIADRQTFYVPSGYVRQLDSSPLPAADAALAPTGSRKAPTKSCLVSDGSDAETAQNDIEQLPPETENAERATSLACVGPEKSTNDGISANTEQSVYANLDTLREAARQRFEGKEVQATEGTDKQNTVYMNLSKIQTSIKQPPLPENAKFVKEYCPKWDMYLDIDTSRYFYFNRDSKEKTWKPPRVEKLASDLTPLQGDFDNKLLSVSPSEIVTPSGWDRQLSADGEECYIHVTTSQKWKKSVDEIGRPYFYMEGGEASSWDLPVFDIEEVSTKEGSSDAAANVAKVKSFTMERQCKPAQVGQVDQKSATLPASFPTMSKESHVPEKNSQSLLSDVKGKAAFLNKTKLVDAGKKVGKKWAQSYVKILGSNLAFYRDQRAAAHTPGSQYGNPELIVNLQGAKVENTNKEVSSKKNVIMVTDSHGSQVLLQSDDPKKIHEWFILLKITIGELDGGYDGQHQQKAPELQHVGNGKESKPVPSVKAMAPAQPKDSKLSGPKTGKHKTSLKRHKSASQEQESNAEKKNKIRDMLVNLIMRRPTLESLEAKGIIKGTVFGSHLKILCEKENTTVPKFVQQSIATIEKRGLGYDGLYRVSGNLAEIQRLRFAVDNNNINMVDLDEKWDIHVLTGAMKLFFRELKEPLFPFDSFDKFFNIVKEESKFKKDERLKMYRNLIAELPQYSHDTMKMLFRHLNKVIEQSSENRMQTQNIAIVFGPTLMWPRKESPNLAVSMLYQNRIVEFILLEYSNIFQ